MKLTTLTALLFIIVPIAFNVTFFLLQRVFEYPDILRKPSDYILKRFKEGGAPLRELQSQTQEQLDALSSSPSEASGIASVLRPQGGASKGEL